MANLEGNRDLTRVYQFSLVAAVEPSGVPDIGKSHALGEERLPSSSITLGLIGISPSGVVSVDFASQSLLLGNEAQRPLEGHLLDRLRRAAIDLPAKVIPLGVGVDA